MRSILSALDNHPHLRPQPTERERIEIPKSFVRFATDLGVHLFDGQRVLARVAFDGERPSDLPPEERAIARKLFGELDDREVSRTVIVAVCGRRAGKTYVIEALRLLHLALTVPLSTLAPGEVASAPIIAPNKALAQQALSYIKGALEHPMLAPYASTPTAESVFVTRPHDGHKVEFVCRAASAKGTAGRSKTVVSFVLDEAAFFYDSNYKVNDEEIYNALIPCLVPGGQALLGSSPYAQSGLIYSLFAQNHPAPSVAGIPLAAECKRTALAIHAPTTLLRGDPDAFVMVERERERDADNARREFDAQFMGTGTHAFFDANAIAQAIDESLVIPRFPLPGEVVAAGGDFGFAKNSSALVVVHRKDSLIVVADIVERKAESDAPLRPSVVVKEFAGKIRAHHGSYLMADAHYREAIIEHLDGSDLSFVDAPRAPEVAFVRCNAMLREGRLRLPNHPKLLRQLRETTSRPRPGGGVSVQLPLWRTGEHGDLVAALVLAVYQIAGEVVPTPAPEVHSKEWEDMQREQRRQEAIERSARSFWRRR